MEVRNVIMLLMPRRKQNVTLMSASHHAWARSAPGASAASLVVVARRTALTPSAALVQACPQFLAPSKMALCKPKTATRMNAQQATCAQEIVD
jgi:hypothetical protein